MSTSSDADEYARELRDTYGRIPGHVDNRIMDRGLVKWSKEWHEREAAEHGKKQRWNPLREFIKSWKTGWQIGRRYGSDPRRLRHKRSPECDALLNMGRSKKDRRRQWREKK